MTFPLTNSYPDPSLTFVTSTSIQLASTIITFASVTTGVAAADRVTVVTCNSVGNAATSAISSITIGGLTAALSSAFATHTIVSAIGLVQNSTGATAAIVVRMNATISFVAVGIYSLTGYQGLTAIVNSTWTSTQTGTSLSIVSPVPAQGAALAFASVGDTAGGTANISWVGTNSDFATTYAGGNNNFGFAGSHVNPPAARNQTFSFTNATTIGTAILQVITVGS